MSDRRRFLKVIAASSLGAMGCAGEDEAPPPPVLTGGVGSSGVGGNMGVLPEGFDLLGNVDDLPEGSLVEHSSRDLLIGRDEGGVYAMSSRCTHQNCNMIGNDGIALDQTISCGCHGSRFDRFGDVLEGPASQPLPHVELFVAEDGTLGVDESSEVPPDTRV